MPPDAPAATGRLLLRPDADFVRGGPFDRLLLPLLGLQTLDRRARTPPSRPSMLKMSASRPISHPPQPLPSGSHAGSAPPAARHDGNLRLFAGSGLCAPGRARSGGRPAPDASLPCRQTVCPGFTPTMACRAHRSAGATSSGKPGAMARVLGFDTSVHTAASHYSTETTCRPRNTRI